jgi:outer membrane protein assembly factor BamB
VFFSRASALLGLIFAIGLAGGASGASSDGAWTRFGYDAARSGSGPAVTGITAANVGRLRLTQVQLGGTADSSPVYAGGLFVVTTSYGRTIAVDAATARIRWRFTPPGYSSWAGTAQITNSSPLIDGGSVYAAAPNGRIYKLDLRTGRQVWSAAITRLPGKEKIGTPLNLSRGLVLATTGGYIGDAPPYQGHVAAIDAASGRLVHVWNALCSDRPVLLNPSACRQSGAAIWARAGVVVEPGSGKLLVATGNGNWNGRTNWGDSVLELSPTAVRLLQNWTPVNQHTLDTTDADLGSTAPALLGSGLAVQGGKDGFLRLLDLRRLNGTTAAAARTGGELQTLRTPGGHGLFSAPAVWRTAGGTWLFVADFSATAGYVLDGRRLQVVWTQNFGGTSPVVAGGLLYLYDPDGGGLRVVQPATGALVATLPAGPGHWNSPIVIDGRIALPEGDANKHRLDGVLDIWR